MALYSHKSSKITKILGIPLLHAGYFRKNHKKRSNEGQLVKNVEAGCENLQPAKFCRLQNFSQPCKILQLPIFLCFLLLFPLVSDLQY